MNAGQAVASEPFPRLGESLDFLRLLWAVDHGLQKASIGMERTIGVTGPQRLVIRVVGRFPGISIGDLARLLFVHPSTATGLAKRLVGRGLIRRRVDPRDRRRFLLGLTDQGRILDREMPGTIESTIGQLLGSLPRGTIDNAVEVLETLQRILATGQSET
jgi:DNA-binding MarR family transcriptional regulator